ncbi:MULTISPECIES: prephenate dehydratase [Pelosinus]|jgi:prephenate dehydratase|uniref:Prephenate dehydratase n=1 Tax=Pelosinus fermentans B4 TaxID=1149862 RepID=I9L9K5_9FIRM|nr:MULTISPECIES: prephenate dehydratase [Pelosinus]EIW17084.1 prephenate dehydratase [Pelosinus fermentans B4]EIW23117.1 prephenate dehydratase [Pelosinus fermentans A11]OAM93841.1 Prephenate dehydratase [Pelosinus fermentans DSM 17108]SDQ91925.1 prephenate dehydratase [Pelosinus fermentans]
MELSSWFGKEAIIGYLGPHGTYSEEVAFRLYNKEQVSFKTYSSIDVAIKAVESGEVSQGIVPVENSLEGSVNVTLDILAHEVNLYIRKEVIWPVRHNLLVKEHWDDVKIIVSHPQALAQCRHNLRRLYPDAELRAMNSTADAATLVASGIENYAAVGSQSAGALYNLQTIAGDIQDSSTNCTRFIVLGDSPIDTHSLSDPCKTSVVCKMNGERPGSLCEILQEFSTRNVNLTRIESRPARTGMGNYIFFFDMDGSIENNSVRSAVEAVKEKSLWFKSFGSYPICTL